MSHKLLEQIRNAQLVQPAQPLPERTKIICHYDIKEWAIRMARSKPQAAVAFLKLASG